MLIYCFAVSIDYLALIMSYLIVLVYYLVVLIGYIIVVKSFYRRSYLLNSNYS